MMQKKLGRLFLLVFFVCAQVITPTAWGADSVEEADKKNRRADRFTKNAYVQAQQEDLKKRQLIENYNERQAKEQEERLGDAYTAFPTAKTYSFDADSSPVEEKSSVDDFESLFEDENDAIDSALETFMSEDETVTFSGDESNFSEEEAAPVEPEPETPEEDELAVLLKDFAEDVMPEELVREDPMTDTDENLERSLLLEEGFEETLNQSQDEFAERSEDHSSYTFSDHLLDAETTIIYEGRGERLGRWLNKRFSFSTLGDFADIQKVIVDTLDRKIHALKFNPIPKAKRRIVFMDVPPGQGLKIEYKASERSGKKKKFPDYLYLYVWLGSHPLDRIRIPTNAEEWISRYFDFGVVQFLNRNVVVTFELTTDTEDPVEFFLSAHV